MAENNKMPVPAKRDKFPHAKEEFRGYSLEELRYQRALIALRKDFCKEQIIRNVHSVSQHGVFGGKVSSVKLGGVAQKLIAGLGYMDYVLIGMSVFSTGKKLFSFFKRSKK